MNQPVTQAVRQQIAHIILDLYVGKNQWDNPVYAEARLACLNCADEILASMQPVTADDGLSPCPFCGSAPTIRRCMEEYPPDNEQPGGEYELGVIICCTSCGIEIEQEYRSESVKAWNKRTSHTALERGAAWQPIDAAAYAAASDDGTPMLIGWYSRDGNWQWVSAYWTGDEWASDEWEIDHVTPTHWMHPGRLPLPPFIADVRKE